LGAFRYLRPDRDRRAVKEPEETTTEELEALRVRVEELLLERQVQKEQREGRKVVEERQVSGGALRHEYV
jgi:hypothetical protein